jgi:ABC-2 type transport system ATP-binding protein
MNTALDSRNPSSAVDLICLSHVTRTYGRVIGVNDLDVTLPQGAYALVGPNGAGKSTLISLITGALKPTLGTVRVFGQDPVRHSSVLSQIGLCPASDILLPGVSAIQWIQQLLALSGWPPRAAAARTIEVLHVVGLDEANHRPISTFSLGMRQRCKLAQAIAHDPKLLILDEPFNGLDPVGRHEMTNMLIDWSKSGKSLLLASHVLHEVEQITDAFLLIYGGRLLASGTAGELRNMLADLPQDLWIVCSDVDRLSQRLTTEPWLNTIQIERENHRIRVSVSQPIELYQALARWSDEDGLEITELSGTDGDLSSLFRLLVSRHRGVRVGSTT